MMKVEIIDEYVFYKVLGGKFEDLSQELQKILAPLTSIESQQIRINPDPASAADEPIRAKSGYTASPIQREAEKEKKENGRPT